MKHLLITNQKVSTVVSRRTEKSLGYFVVQCSLSEREDQGPQMSKKWNWAVDSLSVGRSD